ncbi:MAG TPA: hypothetical protein VM925_02955, partial [Labilithrix sp.]|nr:hypothetical protein [Labilithrix sp.]
VTEGGLLKRARLLALLAYAQAEFREAKCLSTRVLVVTGGEISPMPNEVLPVNRPPSWRARLASFDASRYDRLRVLATELRRVADEGGLAEIRVGRHRLRLEGVSARRILCRM